MKKLSKQSWQMLLATIVMLGVGTSVFAQGQNKRFTLHQFSLITANEKCGSDTAPELFSFTKPSALLAANFNLLAKDNYPKPDFSAMEEWYEVVKYEYDFVDTLPKMLIVVKKKVESAPFYFNIKWFDADGVPVSPGSDLLGLQVTRNTPVGEAIKLYAYAPAENKMPKVKSIVVTRVLAK